MKKVLLIAGILVLVALAAVVVVLKVMGSRPAAPTDYQQTTETGGPIEAAYLQSGPYEVATREDAVLLGLGKFVTYYPAELASSDGAWPVIVICNGSGTPLSKYPAVAEHLASWGFIVVGTEETYDWDGSSAEMCLRYLERWNDNESVEDTESPFYQKVDFDRVGIVGHSQGGAGVFNAITDTRHSATYRAAVALSPTNLELAHGLFWDYDPSLVGIPVLLASGAGGGDDWVVTGEQLRAIYDLISSEKAMMRRCDTAHGEMLYRANGYVVAWFMWHLQGDEEAARAFVGESPEIASNALYQDVATDLGV